MTDDEVIAAATRILEKRIRAGDCLASPQAVRDYLRLAIGDREREEFAVVLLDAQHRVLAMEERFAGTLTPTSVYPREVVVRVRSGPFFPVETAFLGTRSTGVRYYSWCHKVLRFRSERAGEMPIQLGPLQGKCGTHAPNRALSEVTMSQVRTFSMDPDFVRKHRQAVWVGVSGMLFWAVVMLPKIGLQPRDPGPYLVGLLALGLLGLSAWYSVQISRHPEKDAVSVDSDGLWPARLSKEMSLVPWERVHSIRKRSLLKRLDLLDVNGKAILRIEYQLIGFETICALLANYTNIRLPDTTKTTGSDRAKPLPTATTRPTYLPPSGLFVFLALGGWMVAALGTIAVRAGLIDGLLIPVGPSSIPQLEIDAFSFAIYGYVFAFGALGGSTIYWQYHKLTKAIAVSLALSVPYLIAWTGVYLMIFWPSLARAWGL